MNSGKIISDILSLIFVSKTTFDFKYFGRSDLCKEFEYEEERTHDGGDPGEVHGDLQHPTQDDREQSRHKVAQERRNVDQGTRLPDNPNREREKNGRRKRQNQ